MLKRHRLGHWVVGAVAAFLLAASAAGCSKPPTENSRIALRIGYLPIADCLQMYVAMEQGIFAKHGLDVQLTALQAGPRVIEGMSAGDLDIGIANVVSVVTAHARGVPVVSITGGAMEVPEQKTRALLVAVNSPIKTANDLIGKKVAVNGLKNIEHMKLRQYLELNHVPVEKVDVVESPFPQMEGVLRSGAIDAGMAIEPYLSLALKHGTVRVLARPYVETSSRTFVASYVTMQKWLDAHQSTAHAFAESIAEATAYIGSHPDEARRVVLKYNKLPNEVASDVTLPHFEAYFEAAEIQPMIDELARQAIIPSSIPASDVFKRF